MARRGSFSGPTEYFGAPLAIVHPRDNKFPQYDPEIEGAKGLTPKQKKDYQQEIEDLFAALLLGKKK